MNQTTDILGHIRLEFHVKHPTLDECWNEGYDAGVLALDEEDNPYQIGTKEYQFWNDGWWSGFYQEKRLFANPGESEVIPYTQHPISLITTQDAVNESTWGSHATLKKWAGRFVKIAGAIAVTVVAIELLEMAV